MISSLIMRQIRTSPEASKSRRCWPISQSGNGEHHANDYHTLGECSGRFSSHAASFIPARSRRNKGGLACSANVVYPTSFSDQGVSHPPLSPRSLTRGSAASVARCMLSLSFGDQKRLRRLTIEYGGRNHWRHPRSREGAGCASEQS